MRDTAQLLVRLSAQVAEGRSLEGILDFIYAEFQELIPYHRIGYAALDETGELVVAKWARSDREVLLESGFSAPLKGSSLELLAQHRRPRILNDLPSYSTRHPQSESTRLIVNEGLQASLTCPLVTEGKVVGFLFFSHRQPNVYDESHSGVFLQIAGQLALQLMLLEEREIREPVQVFARSATTEPLPNAHTGLLSELESRMARAQQV